MAQLMFEKNKQVICTKVNVANSVWARTKGLLGTQSLPEGECLWIKKCNSIHTWFLNFAIDVIFVDQDLNVIKVYENLNPWKITIPNIKAKSVFEMQSGWIKNNMPQIGDKLYVDA